MIGSMTPPRVDQAAQRLAAENGVDTSHLHGTGPDGEVTVRDVLEQLARLRSRCTGVGENRCNSMGQNPARRP